jgi:hypothetical protein
LPMPARSSAAVVAPTKALRRPTSRSSTGEAHAQEDSGGDGGDRRIGVELDVAQDGQRQRVGLGAGQEERD